MRSSKIKIIGTYQIINIVNQKTYVGSSDDITKRWKEHKRDLKAGAEGRVNEKGEPIKHHNEPLQRAWIKYGAAAFQFNILEINDTHEEALQDEQLLINALWDGGETCYNIAKDATSGMTGRHHTKEAKEKLSACFKGKKGKPWTQDKKDAHSALLKGKERSPEWCAAIGATKKGNTWNIGKKHPWTQDQKDAQSATQKAVHALRRERRALAAEEYRTILTIKIYTSIL